MMLFIVTAMRPDLLIKFLMGPRDTCGKVREDVRDLYVAKKSKNASRLSALSDEWDNLTQVAIRMGYPRELMSDDLFGAVQTYCEARQETQLQLQRRLGAAPWPFLVAVSAEDGVGVRGWQFEHRLGEQQLAHGISVGAHLHSVRR